MRTRPATAVPDRPDPVLMEAVQAAEELLGDRLERVGVCFLDGVAHTWGDCPYAPSIDGILPWPGAEVEAFPVRELLRMRQCLACAAGLRRNGATRSWLLRQLDPAAAAAARADGRIRTGEAIRRCTPTGLVPAAAVALLLPPAGALLPGLVYLVERVRAPVLLEDALEQGYHSPDGLSLITDVDGRVQRMSAGHHWIRPVGVARAEDDLAAAARVCLRLAARDRTSEDLWGVAAALLHG